MDRHVRLSCMRLSGGGLKRTMSMVSLSHLHVRRQLTCAQLGRRGESRREGSTSSTLWACWVCLALVLLQSMTPTSICTLALRGCTVIWTKRIWRSIHCTPSELELACSSTNWTSRPPLSRIAFIGGQIPLWTIYVIHPHCNVACSVSMIGSCLFVCFVG